ncbi:MAG: crotonase/enoyl-CoA hydratase family protein [Bacteroidetes bacterium]|jgi:enoyl-CoA hydratase|nr:crotonase/enoyl-CoA hydratase family protein [Bacteroidota bacterium]
MSFASDVLTLDRSDHVATVTLDRPARKNAFGTAFWTDFPEVIQQCTDDAGTRVILLTAAGSVFSAGLDLQDMGPLLLGAGADPTADPPPPSAAERQRLRQQIQRMQEAFTAVADCPKPVIAAIHGPCIGAGVDLITACDIRLAAANAVFSVRETRMAMVPDLGTLQRLRGIVPDGYVAELVYTGRDIDAAHAQTIGLVNDVFDDRTALRAGAKALADRIAANAPQAVQGAKQMLRAARRTDEQEGLERVALHNAAFLPSDDLREALTAFFEKRSPTFTGS